MENLYIAIIFVIVGIIGYFIGKNSAARESELKQSKLQLQFANLEKDKLKFQHINETLLSEITQLKKAYTEQIELTNHLQEKLVVEYQKTAVLQEKQKNLENAIVTQKKDLLDARERFSKEFELVANKILEEKTERFTAQNNKKLGEILEPFSSRIREFKEEVAKSSYTNTKERTELKEQIKHLAQLNLTMQKETKNLSKALRQDSKAQGNWGEVILERVLEKSGLEKGREYFTQETYRELDDSKMMRPDVVVRLPDDRNIIIDSKVSLTAYTQLINAESDEVRALALKAHLKSIKNHITGLAAKNYQFASGLETPDFVLLFLPIESSFSIATQADNELFNFAWNRKIVIVSPSTLLATLRTISSVWKNEYQNKNAKEIAERAGKLYDKFVGFVADMEKLNKQLRGVDEAYQSAFNKLSSGKGNLIGMVQKVVDLGVKTKKKLPPNLLDNT